MEKPVADLELEQAVACRLVESDGSRWEVRDVTLENGRAWVRAEFLPPTNGGGPEGDGRDCRSSVASAPLQRLQDRSPRVFDTILTSGARLVWHLPGGRRVIARGNGDGSLDWSIEETDPREANFREPTTRGGFFQDPFLDA